MAITVKVEPINRDIRAFIDEDLSPSARSKALAQFAQETIDETRRENRAAIGQDQKYEVTVDGRRGAALVSVQPDGVIFVEFEYLADLVTWISQRLHENSPVHHPDRKKPSHAPGLYKRSHLIFIDGQQFTPGAPVPPVTEEVVFVNEVAYARQIELGESKQAPDGVYQAVALLARNRFGNLARITFTYRGLIAGQTVSGRAGNRSEVRNPAIVVRTR